MCHTKKTCNTNNFVFSDIVVNHPFQVQQTQTGRSIDTLLVESYTIPVCEKGVQ